MNRRTLLSALPAALLLTGCATVQTIATDLGPVVSDAKLIQSGLVAIATALPSSVAAKVQTYASDVGTAVSALSTAVTTAGARPSVATIEAAVNGAMDAIGTLPLPPPYSDYLLAARTLVGVIEAAVKLAGPAKASPGGMTAENARLVLAGARQRQDAMLQRILDAGKPIPPGSYYVGNALRIPGGSNLANVSIRSGGAAVSGV